MSKKNQQETGAAPIIINDPLSSGGVNYAAKQKVESSPGSYEGCYITLFPREKKKKTSPDYGGSISRSKDDVVGDCITYAHKKKDGALYMVGMLFVIPDPIKIYIDIESMQMDDINKPAIVGTIKISGIMYKLAMWQKQYEKGIYYSGSIGQIVVGG